MPKISSFHIQLDQVNFAQTVETKFDLMIVESGYYSKVTGLTLSPTEVAALQEQGRTVVAYLNVAVTDHNRDYWEDSWVNYADGGNRDVGPIDASTNPPAWLTGHHGYATSGDETFGVTTQLRYQAGFDGVYRVHGQAERGLCSRLSEHPSFAFALFQQRCVECSSFQRLSQS